MIQFPDHHWFTEKDIARITKAYDDQFTRSKIIVTTEKDFYRLKHKKCFDDLRKKPVFYIPVSMKIHTHAKGIDFNQAIRDYVKNNTKHFGLDPATN
jgi:tetraacyldisaccharide 4'-kinase